jgi:folylpolyglutamate synthase
MAAFLRKGPASRPWASLHSATRCSSLVFSLAISKERSFEKAVELLETLQSNKQVVKTVSTSRQDANTVAIPEMLSLLRKVGYLPEDFTNRLNFIHVAGAKG